MKYKIQVLSSRKNAIVAGKFTKDQLLALDAITPITVCFVNNPEGLNKFVRVNDPHLADYYGDESIFNYFFVKYPIPPEVELAMKIL